MVACKLHKCSGIFVRIPGPLNTCIIRPYRSVSMWSKIAPVKIFNVQQNCASENKNPVGVRRNHGLESMRRFRLWIGDLDSVECSTVQIPKKPGMTMTDP